MKQKPPMTPDRKDGMRDNPSGSSGVAKEAASTLRDGSAREGLCEADDDAYYEKHFCVVCGMPNADCECCPHCQGAGERPLISGLEWDYIGSDYDTCPDCGGTGRL